MGSTYREHHHGCDEISDHNRHDPSAVAVLTKRDVQVGYIGADGTVKLTKNWFV